MLILLTMLIEQNPCTESLSEPIEMIEQMLIMNSKSFYRPCRAQNRVVVFGDIKISSGDEKHLVVFTLTILNM